LAATVYLVSRKFSSHWHSLSALASSQKLRNVSQFLIGIKDVTKLGIQLFFPATLRCLVPGNRKLRLATGSNWEYAILAVVVALGLLVFGINTRGGLASTFNEILATPWGIQEIPIESSPPNPPTAAESTQLAFEHHK
jgi:hypothetical protein